MGLFGRIGSAIKNGFKKAKEWVSDKVNKAKEGVKNLWNKFTGKSTFEEAEKLYDAICQRYNSRRKKFDADVDAFCNDIENHVNAINKYKARIKKELLPQMSEKISKICDVTVLQKYNCEEFKITDYSFDELNSKEKLYKIDFNKHPIKNNVLAVVTLGFLTRKKAKETLDAVKEEEAKVNAEIAKMDAQIKKLETIEIALANVEEYFDGLTELYERLLVRLDSSVNFLIIRCMNIAQKIIKKEMSINNLSIVQQKEISAIFKASAILKKMAETQLLSLEKADDVSEYNHNMQEQYNEIITLSKAA